MEEEIPEYIGKYKIKRQLGEGAMGIVYEGVDEAIDRRVAIKTLHSHLLNKRDGKEFLQRFQREAKSAARCTHPNIVMVLEYGQQDDIPFIAMEFIDGMSLQDFIETGQKISLKNALAIISQLLKAIHAAHQLGVIHRDIKTANIMLCKKNNAIKLADFGIARFTENPSMTMTGAVVGTPRYMAPEQLFGLKADQRADLFSLAMVFVEVLSTLPENTPAHMSRMSPIDGLPPNNKINYACLYPTGLIPVLEKSLASKPDNRFQSAQEFAAALKNALPDLKNGGTSSVHDDATLVPGSVVQQDPLVAEDLDSLTSILSEYIGPVARNVMKQHSSTNTSLSDLVTSISQEIPHANERQEFIKKWEKKSGTGSLRTGTGSQTSQSGNSQVSTRGTTIRMDENTIQKIARDLVNYIGPFAPRLVDYYCQEASDKEQFLKSLSDEIPNQNSREEFLKKWSMV